MAHRSFQANTDSGRGFEKIQTHAFQFRTDRSCNGIHNGKEQMMNWVFELGPDFVGGGGQYPAAGIAGIPIDCGLDFERDFLSPELV